MTGEVKKEMSPNKQRSRTVIEKKSLNQLFFLLSLRGETCRIEFKK